MAEDFSYFWGRPRRMVHGGTPPPRRYLRGVGRRVVAGRRVSADIAPNILVFALILLGLAVLSRK